MRILRAFVLATKPQGHAGCHVHDDMDEYAIDRWRARRYANEGKGGEAMSIVKGSLTRRAISARPKAARVPRHVARAVVKVAASKLFCAARRHSDTASRF